MERTIFEELLTMSKALMSLSDETSKKIDRIKELSYSAFNIFPDGNMILKSDDEFNQDIIQIVKAEKLETKRELCKIIAEYLKNIVDEYSTDKVV